jgi:proteasome lid subunit RPN8/RPN11
MLHGLVSTASRLLNEFQRSLLGPRFPARAGGVGKAPEGPPYAPLQRILMTDGVGRTLFEGYAAHRAGTRGDEETGWMLLGFRQASEAVVLATLPAGGQRDASAAHVRFNSSAQALASRIVRQTDRRLTTLGVVHTHPGSLRHPSDADLSGDAQWVGQLRGKEGVFGIGTADAGGESQALFACQPRPNMYCLGGLRFSWYALREGDSRYRSLPVELTLGPDLARDLHLIWSTLELHAERIDRLYCQQSGLRVEVVVDEDGPGVLLILPLAGGGDTVRVLLRSGEVRYFLEREGKLMRVEQQGDPYVDRGVYRLLAELSAAPE